MENFNFVKQLDVQQENLFYFYEEAKNKNIYAEKGVHPSVIMFTDSLSLEIVEGVYAEWHTLKAQAKLSNTGEWIVSAYFKGEKIAEEAVSKKMVVSTAIKMFRLQLMAARQYCTTKKDVYIVMKPL